MAKISAVTKMMGVTLKGKVIQGEITRRLTIYKNNFLTNRKSFVSPECLLSAKLQKLDQSEERKFIKFSVGNQRLTPRVSIKDNFMVSVDTLRSISIKEKHL